VLIHRVHGLSQPDAIEERYGRIVEFERELVASGTTLVKVMLHISPAEQKRRLKQRLERPDKHWKFSPGDITERSRWEEYMTAYQIAIERTSTEEAPWHVVPADRKWFARLAVHRLLLGALRALGQDWPKAEFDVETELRRLAAT
jgi:polyphosphate kinase 2 (PPK2 family)